MRVAFFGTGDVSAAYLASMLDSGVEVTVVVTKPPKRRSRRGAVEPTPVEQLGQRNGIKVLTSLAGFTDGSDDQKMFDLGVVVSYGRLLPASLVTNLPFLNVHYSLLPAFRGAAPVERSVLAGGLASGVTLMRLVEEMDAGPIYASRRVEIGGLVLSEAYRRLTVAGTQLLAEWLDRQDDWLDVLGRPQEGRVTIAAKISSDDLLIRSYESAEQGFRRHLLERAFFYCGERRVRLVSAHVEAGDTGATLGTIVDGRIQTARDLLVPELVRPEGRGTMTFAEFLRGSHVNRIGTVPHT